MNGALFMLTQRKPEQPAQLNEVLNFFVSALKNGQKLAMALDCVPIPAAPERLLAM